MICNYEMEETNRKREEIIMDAIVYIIIYR